MTRILSNLTQTTAPDANASVPAYSLSLQSLPRTTESEDAEWVRRMLARRIVQRLLSQAREAQR